MAVYIRIPLGTEVSLSLGDIVIDGDPAPPSPKDTEIGLGPGDFVLDGDPAAPPQKGGGAPLPSFRPMSIVAKRQDGSRWHLAWR